MDNDLLPIAFAGGDIAGREETAMLRAWPSMTSTMGAELRLSNLGTVPAIAFALFLGDLFHYSECSRTAILPRGCDYRVD
jgi:hypothetical protein